MYVQVAGLLQPDATAFLEVHGNNVWTELFQAGLTALL